MEGKRRGLLVVGILLCGAAGLLGLILLLGVGPAAPQVSAIVRWQTASELDTAGFNLYRSEHPDGPFTQRVNPVLIPAGTTPLVGASYVYTDTNVQLGRVYYYELEEVENDGTRTRIGRIAVRVAGPSPLLRLVGGVLLLEAIVVGWGMWRRWRRGRLPHA